MKPTDEVALFISTTRAFLDRHATIGHQRALHAEDRCVDAQWWRQAAELGWAGLLVPEELGGGNVSGSGLHDLAAVAEQLGHTVAPGPLHPVSTVLAGLVDADNRSEHADTIHALTSGQAVATWAVDEPGRQFSPQRPSLTATPTATGYRLDGVKDRVEAGAQADLLLVTAQADDGLRQFLIPADAYGLSRHPRGNIDLVKRYARVEFDAVTVDNSAAVGSVAQTPALIERQSHVAMLLQCAETVGILDTVLSMTLDWARDRYSFGRPLASYQAIKHRLADKTMWLHACRAVTAGAVDRVAARASDAGVWVSAAKSYLGEHAGPLVQDCVQLHGGIGVTWEHDLHLFLRRITLYRNMFGTPSEHHQAIYRQARPGGPAA
ncbi:acyl-CoA dehydrogenase [Mycobacterium intermedium]|uniref:Acyl-CoA dehydrogenase n=1 Tax=Mycobacterium intermedium TaxID=28445 RepID=A0A1E3SAW7_MYCIE|nr:acyl-CoA dehydrogenase family protein [Mycobacterium intermedium]MCV6967480.1 acyl-CoA/acyl-ACP dehydrogenase [Mycobacterium intermedium]ODQ99306.1 acyl-CoA dehydrogenase [Mycobacterium intermedium]OPE49973.1 acyl-CoA dehydrogenase [Mycobacterium intermedium]ORB07763.1 acyl-CoA dehydrogenase [Mycobacterium intermedium]